MTHQARVYVGTYAKYNMGSINGKWLNVEDYTCKEEFVAACIELHKNEHDPELMFQDYEGFPCAYYGESHIKPELWDWLELDESDRELLSVYQNNIESDATIDQARDAYMGRANSEADWAAEWLDDTGALQDCPEILRNYFDYEAYARDARLGGDVVFVRHDGELWVFSNH